MPHPGILSGPSDSATAPQPTGAAIARVPLAADKVKMPSAGERNSYGITVSAVLAEAYRGYMAGDGESALSALDAAETDYQGNPLALWHLSTQRVQVLLMMGRSADVGPELDRNAEMEITLFGTDSHARALRAETAIWMGDPEEAIAHALAVVGAYGDWRLPTSYAGPPSNLAELFHATTAQLRAEVVLGLAHLFNGDFDDARRWAADAEHRFADVHYVAAHPIYGSVLAVHSDSFYGRATNLATLGAAALALREEQAESWLQAADRFFDAVGYRAGNVTVAALRAYALLHSGQIDAAIKAGADATALAQARGIADMVWRVEALRGKALAQGGRMDQAEAAYRRAQAAVDQVSGSLWSDHAKRRFGIGKEDLTRALVRIDVAKRNLEQLFIDLERGRARAFVDMLAQRPLAVGRQPEKVAAIRALDARIRALRLKLQSPAGGSSDLQTELPDLLEQRQRKLAELHEVDAELAELMSVTHADLATARRQLQPREHLLYTFAEQQGRATSDSGHHREPGRNPDPRGTPG